MKRTGWAILTIPLLWFALGVRAAETRQDEWPQWRGPNRNGVAAAGPKLLDAWPAGGPALLWKSEPIPCTVIPERATDGGAGSPVVAEGRVFVYADVLGQYLVTGKMMSDWGWLDGVPDELATQIEHARLAQKREKLAGAELEKYIAEFMATLAPEQARTYGEHIRKRIGLGRDTAGWLGMQTIAGAGAIDKPYKTYGEWEKIAHKGKSFRDHDLVDGHGDGGLRGNYIQNAVLKNAGRTDCVYCFDAASGKLLWKKEYPGRSEDKYGFYWFSGASSTPAIAQGRCYVVGTGGVYCLSVKDGKEIWQAPTKLFTHSSPLVANGMVYVLFGFHGDNRCIIPGELTAFHAETGAVVWKQPKVASQYSSPVLWTGKDGKSALICLAWGGPYLVDPLTGNLLCALKGPIGWWAEYGTPSLCEDTFTIMSYGGKRHAYKINYPNAEKIWEVACSDDRGASDLSYQGHGYVFGRGGSSCYDLATGQIKWKGQTRNNEAPSAAMADGKIFTHGAGTFKMYKLTAEGEKLLGQMPDPSCAFTSPAIAYGKLYIRGPDGILCYDLEAK